MTDNTPQPDAELWDLDNLQGIIQEIIAEDKTPFRANSPIVSKVIAEQIVKDYLPPVLETYADRRTAIVLEELKLQTEASYGEDSNFAIFIETFIRVDAKRMDIILPLAALRPKEKDNE